MNSFVFNRSLLVLINLILFASAEQFFVDNPPASFYNRKSIHDCVDIFYSKRNIPIRCATLGGVGTGPNEFPHMAAIGWTSNGKIEYKCGGTLITSKFVLTAAHCAINSDGKAPDTIRLGDVDLEGTYGDDTAQQIKIRSFKRHPKHRFKKKYFDIALIELESDVEFTKSVCPACLWLENDIPSDAMQSIGFGATGFADSSRYLQKVSLSPIGKHECNERFSARTRSLPNGIVDHQFCAGSSYMDTCSGDSGGPIQINKEDVYFREFPLVVGVVSFGTPCTNGSSGVYTRASDFREWIESETGTSMDYLTCMDTTKSLRRRNDHGLCWYGSLFHEVSILWNVSDRYQCSATMIDFQYALTSAYCVKKKHNLPKFIKSERSDEIVEIAKVFIHPHYSSEQPENDLALLQLSKYLKDDQKLTPACLERKNTPAAGYAEFSAYLDEKDSSRIYIQVGGRISEQNRSVLFWAKHPYPLVPRVCHLNHGGAIVYRDTSTSYLKAYYLKGVVSNLGTDCDKSFAGIPLSSAHVEWINDIVIQHSTERFIVS